MGYDMHLVEKDQDAAQRTEEARVAFYTAAEERDQLVAHLDYATDAYMAAMQTPEYQAAQAKVMALSEAMDQANTNYFRLNIWGMSRMRENLHELGMLAVHYDSYPDWPDAGEFGITDQDLDAVGWWDLEVDERLNHADERLRNLAKANHEVITWSPPDEPGLPAHKFGSNDGWVVTPRDIKGALVAYEKAVNERPDVVEKIRDSWRPEDDPAGRSYFDDWLDFLRAAEERAGFEVW